MCEIREELHGLTHERVSTASKKRRKDLHFPEVISQRIETTILRQRKDTEQVAAHDRGS